MWRWLWLCLLPLIGSAEYVERAVAPAEARSYSLPDASGCYAVTVTGTCGAETLESAPSNRVCRTAPISLNWSQQMLCEDGSGLAGIERFTIYEWMEGGPPPPLLQPGPGSLASLWQFDASPMDPPPAGDAVMWKDVRFYQSTEGTSPRTVTLTEQPEIGDEMVILQWIPSWHADRTGWTLTDNAGNTWTADATITPTGTNTHRHIYWRATISSVPSTVSFAWTGSSVVTYFMGAIVDASLVPLTFGDSDFWTAGYGGADFGVTLTAAQDDELVLGWGVLGASVSFSVTPSNLNVVFRLGDWYSLHSDSLGAAGDRDVRITGRSAQSQNYMVAAAYRTTAAGAVDGSVAQAAAAGDVAGSIARLPVSQAQAASGGIDLSDTMRRTLAASQAGAADDAVSSRVRALRSTSQGAAGASAEASLLRAVETIAAGGSSADNAIAWLRALVSAEQAAAGAAAADALLSLRVALAQGAAGSDAATGDILGSLEVNTSTGAAGGDVSATLATFAVSIHQTAAGAESGAAAARLLLGLEQAAAAGLSVDVSADVVRSLSEGAAGAASQDREVFGQRVSVVQAAAGSDGMSAAQRAVAAAIQSAIGDGIAYAIQAGLLNIEQGAAAGFSATAVLESDRFVLVGEVRIDSQSPVIRVVSIRSISGTNDA